MNLTCYLSLGVIDVHFTYCLIVKISRGVYCLSLVKYRDFACFLHCRCKELKKSSLQRTVVTTNVGIPSPTKVCLLTTTVSDDSSRNRSISEGSDKQTIIDVPRIESSTIVVPVINKNQPRVGELVELTVSDISKQQVSDIRTIQSDSSSRAVSESSRIVRPVVSEATTLINESLKIDVETVDALPVSAVESSATKPASGVSITFALVPSSFLKVVSPVTASREDTCSSDSRPSVDNSSDSVDSESKNEAHSEQISKFFASDRLVL